MNDPRLAFIEGIGRRTGASIRMPGPLQVPGLTSPELPLFICGSFLSVKAAQEILQTVIC